MNKKKIYAKILTKEKAKILPLKWKMRIIYFPYNQEEKRNTDLTKDL
jgi:hypothetical protein